MDINSMTRSPLDDAIDNDTYAVAGGYLNGPHSHMRTELDQLILKSLDLVAQMDEEGFEIEDYNNNLNL